MSDLFDIDGNSAIFSADRNYRYLLFRYWDRSKPIIAFIGLNPSTANENTDDPTIRRVKKFAATWGYGGICMANLFALVTSKPEVLMRSDDPVGNNDKYLQNIVDMELDVVFAWGSFPFKERAEQVIKMFPKAQALHINQDGSPMHPLYVRADKLPVNFK